jgi:hypothetical protein
VWNVDLKRGNRFVFPEQSHIDDTTAWQPVSERGA